MQYLKWKHIKQTDITNLHKNVLLHVFICCSDSIC